MSANAHIRPDLEQLLGRATFLLPALKERGEQLAAKARATNFGSYSVGNYVKGIKVDAGVEQGVLTARVNATDFKSHWLEFGTQGTSPTPIFQPLRAAAESLGFKLGGRKK